MLPAATLILCTSRIFLLALTALVLIRFVTGSINVRGLLKDRETGGVSALRVQMLIGTVIAAVVYAAEIGKSSTTALPPVDIRLLELVAAANGLVIGNRAFAKLAMFLRTITQARAEERSP